MNKNDVNLILDSVIKSNPNAFDFNFSYYYEKYHRDGFCAVNLDNKGWEIDYFVIFYNDIDSIDIERCMSKKGTSFYKITYHFGKNQHVHCVDIVNE